MRMKYFLLGALSSFLIIAVSFISFYFGKNDSRFSSNLSPTPTVSENIEVSVPETINIQEETKEAATLDDIKQIIKDALVDKKYLDLVPFMTSPFVVRIVKADCCLPEVPIDAVEHFEYLRDAESPWGFGQQNEIVNNLAATYPEHYSNAFIGVSDNRFLVAFQFEDNMISKVSMINDYRLLIETQ